MERLDEGDALSGVAADELQQDGSLEIELSFYNGDDATLAARPQLLEESAAS